MVKRGWTEEVVERRKEQLAKPEKKAPRSYRAKGSYIAVMRNIEGGQHYEKAVECVEGLVAIASAQTDLPPDSSVRVAALSSALKGHLALLNKIIPNAMAMKRDAIPEGGNVIQHESALAILERAGALAEGAARNGFPVLRGSSGTNPH